MVPLSSSTIKGHTKCMLKFVKETKETPIPANGEDEYTESGGVSDTTSWR